MIKRKIFAALLGLTLSVTSLASVSVCAEEETSMETEAEDSAGEETDEEDFIMVGRIDIIGYNNTIVIAEGELLTDETDSSVGTLELSGTRYQLTFAEDAVGVVLNDLMTVTVVEAPEDSEEDSEMEEVADEAVDTDESGAEAETESKDASETETEAETETETETDTTEITLSELVAGDIVICTLSADEDYQVVSFTMIAISK